MSSITKQTGKRSLAYIISFSAAYGLPIVIHFIATIVLTIPNSTLPAIIGMLLLGAIIYAPFYGIYYALLTFIHAVTDIILPPRRKLKYVFWTIISALLPSSLLISGSILALLSDRTESYLVFGYTLILIGFALIPIGFLRFIFHEFEENGQ